MATTPEEAKRRVVGKYKEGDELLSAGEMQAPDIIRRYYRAFRAANGARAARFTKDSMKWFADRISKDTKAHRFARFFFTDDHWRKRSPGGPIIGKLYYFVYHAIDEGGQLPYWDATPLVFFFNESVSSQGKQLLHGLNMHYLPPRMRFLLMWQLLKLRTEKRYRPSTRLKLSWLAIKAVTQSKSYEHCVKTYRVDHIRSRLVEIPADEWALVIPMQIAEWKKSTRSRVYQDARKKK